MNVNLDEKDFAIIDELKKNSRLSEQKLAKKTNIPMTTVHNRIKKLQANGIIKKYTIELDYAKLGKSIVAYVMLKAIASADQKALLEQVAKIPQVREVAMITGEFDLLFKVKVSSMEELNELVVQKLRKQKTVGETRTMISYETVEIN
ncbi:Lrp/AsnC family transcriptional regulator [Candidatus Micrarchaeota archaeon]|nr:Lrp/AsnC family transcriptional regulator [Candidatus Micrarchaeota archaeon]